MERKADFATGKKMMVWFSLSQLMLLDDIKKITGEDKSTSSIIRESMALYLERIKG